MAKVKITDGDLLDSIDRLAQICPEVFRHHGRIRRTAAYIYGFALPWCPRTSLLRRRYGDEPASKVKVLKGLESPWDRCSRTIFAGYYVKPVLFSHDGRLLLEGRTWRSIKRLQAGACLTKIQEDALYIAISVDDQLVASAGGMKTKVWDIQTSELVHLFSGHTCDISCLQYCSHLEETVLKQGAASPCATSRRVELDCASASPQMRGIMACYNTSHGCNAQRSAMALEDSSP